MFDLNKFNTVLETDWVGQDLRYFEELDSTNSYLKQIPSDEITPGMVCFADNQTKGRGQYERDWESEPACNLTFTVAFQPSRPERLHVLTLACARAAVKIVEKETGQSACIKWPNDVIVKNRKIGGLLTETVFSGNQLDRVLVGIGFNINQDSFNGEFKDKATSMKLLKGKTFQREQLLADYLSLMEYCYILWHQNNIELLRSINKKLIGYGQWINLAVNGHSRTDKYKLLGINEKGQLTMLNEEAEVERFSYEQIRLITD